MRERLSILAAACATLLFGACAEWFFDLEGTRCGEDGQCGGELVCDLASNTCQRAPSVGDAGSETDGGSPDAGVTSDGGENGDGGVPGCEEHCAPLGRCATSGVGCECLGGSEPCDQGCCQAQRIALGADHTCRLDDTGRARCWGDNTWGQLGDPLVTADGGTGCVPRNDWANREFESITAGSLNTCGIDSERRLFCWGDNRRAQVSSPPTPTALPPTRVSVLRRFATVSMAGKHGCGLTFESELHCWGLGAPAVTIERVLGVAVGGGDKEGETPFTCVIEPNERAVLCFRDGTPTPERRLEGVLAIAAGETHACAITAERQVACWQPGGESAPQIILKSDLSTLSKVVQVAAGFERTCAVDDAGKVWCWGRLDCATTDLTTNAVEMLGVSAKAGGIDFGRSHGCFEDELSVMYCYGDSGSGQVAHCGGCIDTLLPVN